MAQNVLECVADTAAPLLSSLDELVKPKTSVLTLKSSEEHALQFRPADEAIESFLSDLLRRQLSAILVNSSGSVRYGLLTCPNFNRQPLSKWMLTLELTDETWYVAWSRLLDNAAAEVVCVGLEEGIELSDNTILPEFFPWKDIRLLAGAVRGEHGSWDIRTR